MKRGRSFPGPSTLLTLTLISLTIGAACAGSEGEVDDPADPAVDSGAGGAVTGSGGGGGGAGGAVTGSGGASATDGQPSAERFSFFYTSLAAMQRLSGQQVGFGGDLRFGTSNGLEGADKICKTIATDVDAAVGGKTWRAFLSAVHGPDGQPVHAIDRIGEGPWYDRLGRLVAENRAGLLGGDRPAGDALTAADLPDETGAGTKRLGDTHDVVTGSNRAGQLRSPGVLANTCQDWTSAAGTGQIGVGHSWPAGSGRHWVEVHIAHSCVAGVNLVQNGPGNHQSIGAGGGWGGFYCFALTP
jgi:hypothetical protein